MKQLKCETCGATLELSGDGLHAQCAICGNVYEYRSPKEEMAVQQMNEANDLRINMNFDDAIKKYRLVTKNNPEDAEGYWGLLLSKYGIAYEYEPDTKKYVPTFHRNRRGNILEDVNAQNALKYASDAQKVKYETALKELRYIQEGIENFADNCDPYDVFISFKATEIGGEAKTIDRDIAYNIYDELNSRGIRTFFSEVSLRSMVAEDYEAIIFSALNTCRVFILVGTSKDNIDSLWVKNEWTRYSERVADDRLNGLPASSRFAVIGGDLKPSELPREFARTQNVMLSNYAGDSYKKDVAYSVEKLLGIEKKEKKSELDEDNVKEMLDKLVKEKVGTGGKDFSSLLKRMYMFLQDGQFDDADKYAERVLDIDPECADAYLGKLLAAYKCRKKEQLSELFTPFNGDINYINIKKYGSDELKAELEKYLADINNNIVSRDNDNNLAALAKKLKTHMTKDMDHIPDVKKDLANLMPFKDWRGGAKPIAEAEQYLANCYDAAINAAKNSDYVTALSVLTNLGDYKDAAELLEKYNDEFHEKTYQQCKVLIDKHDLDTAMLTLTLLGDYKDAPELLKHCELLEQGDKYNDALEKAKNLDFDKAIRQFNAVKKECTKQGFKELLDMTNQAIDATKSAKTEYLYSSSLHLYETANYAAAKEIFDALGDYKESKAMSKKCEKAITKSQKKLARKEKNNTYEGRQKRKKRIKTLVVLILVAVIGLGGFITYEVIKNNSVVVEGVKYFKVKDGYTVMKLQDKAASSPVIKDTVEGKPVVAVGDFAFMGTKVTNINLPLSVKKIGNHAFEACDMLSSINLGNVTHIGDSAFNECTNLAWSGLNMDVEYVGKYAFSGCDSIYEVVLPESITDISEGVFSECKNLSRVTLGSSVKTIGKRAFYDSKTIKEVKFPVTLESIGDSAFERCTGLQSIVLPNSVKTLGKSVYKTCSSVTLIVLSENLTVIPANAFEGIMGTAEIIIPASVETIEPGAFLSNHAQRITFDGDSKLKVIKKNAFRGCSVESLILPSSVETIEDCAFEDARISYLYIPKNVKKIGKTIVLGCDNISKIHIEGNSVGEKWHDQWNVVRADSLIGFESKQCEIVYNSVPGIR